jgi:PAS domain S-box-containing protein
LGEEAVTVNNRKSSDWESLFSAEQFRIVAENVRDNIWIMDLATMRYTYLSPSVEQHLGYTPAEALALELTDHLAPASIEMVAGFLAEEMARDGQPGVADDRSRALEIEVVGKDGRRMWGEVTASFLRDDAGRPDRILGVTRNINERKKAGELERKNAAALAQAERIANLGYFERNWQTGESLWSEGFRRLLGVDIEAKFSHEEFLRFVHDDDRERVAKHVKRSLDDRTQMSVDFRIVRDGSETIAVHGIGDNEYDDDGCPIVTRGVFQDVTEAVQAETLRLESEERYRLVAENASDNIWILRLADRALTFVSPSCEKIFGFTPEETMAMPLEDQVPPQSVEKIMNLVAEEIAKENDPTVEKDRSTVFELEQYIKDGRTIWTEITASFIRDAQGRPESVLGISRDIKKRKRVEKLLKKQERLLNFAIEQMPVPVIIANAPDGRISKINQSALDLMTKQVERIDDLTLDRHREAWQTFHPDGAPFATDELPLTQAIQQGKSTRGREIIVRHGDKDRWVAASAAPLIDEDGDIVAGIVVFPEITARKEAEQARAMIEEQLHQSQKMESIGRLAGGVAHDFNNLLTAIIGYCEMLESSLAAGTSQAADVGEIKNAALSASGLTAQLLAFSRKQVISPKVVNLNNAVAHALKMLNRLIEEDIQLEFSPGPDLWATRFDLGQLDQILINLVVNARDALPEGGALSIATANVELHGEVCHTCGAAMTGRYVVLTVTDNGIGMDEATRVRIFEPFFTTKEVGAGSGLGLSMIHGIVHQHEGHVGVDTEPGQGTVFHVYLPRAIADTEARVREFVPLLLRGDETVLLAEDQDGLRRLGTRILEQNGYRVLAAESGAAAFALSEAFEGKIDLLLTDVVMPGMNGNELYRRIAASRPGTRVLFMSGYTQDAIAHRGVLEEQTAFIQKPFMIDALLRKVREVIDAPPPTDDKTA